MIFTPQGRGHMTGRPSSTRDEIDIRKVGQEWQLTVREEHTGQPLHTFRSLRQYECCQEACRYFGEGAFANPMQASK